MQNEFTRKCSHCRYNGHNSRTCSEAGFKLFGVQIDVASEDGCQSSIRKSKSLGNLEACNGENTEVEASGYLSDGLVHTSSRLRKKGKPWSEDEHRSFLMGLEKLGKGDWKGIANNFVPSRNSSQVASHAQKYFNRLASTEKKRRRTSVFDIPLRDVNLPSQVVPGSQSSKAAESSEPTSMQAPVATSERPPLSPMRKHRVPDLRSVLCMPRVSSSIRGFSGQTAVPTVSWIPVVNFLGPSSSAFHLPNYSHGALASCSPFVPQPALATLKQSLKKQGSSSSQAAATRAENNGLKLNIRELTL